MANTIKNYSFWKEVRTGCIYKYEVGVKPFRADQGAWIQVSGYEYDKALEDAYKKFLENA